MRYDVALLAPGVSGKARAAERGWPRSRSVTPHGASGASNPEGAGGQALAILRYRPFTWNNHAARAMPCLAAAWPPVRRLIL